MTRLLSLSTNGYTNTKFLVIISIVISALIVDFSLSNVSDIMNVSTWWGVAAFISIAFIYIVGQYLILQFVKQKGKITRMNVLHFGQLATMMMIAHYVLTAVIVLVVVQILMNSYYYTSLLIWNSLISYSIACFLILILALKFISWYKVNRNPIVLSYGISSVLIAISIASTLIFCTATLQDLSNKISPYVPSGLEDKEVGHGPDIQLFNQTTMVGKVQTVFTIFHILSFLSLWISTILLLHTYSQKLGKVKFWSTIGIPIVFYVSIFVIVTPFVQSFSNITDSSLRIAVDVFGYILPAISSGILFGFPFWMIAMTLNYGNILRYYLLIAYSGIILFELASTNNVIPASYPPFGLVSISFVCTSSYLILMGIYSSTISIAKDHKLRQSIRKNTKELKLLDSIGTSQMEQEIQKRVSAATRATQEGVAREAGIQSFINEDDMKQYLQQVIEDVKESENKSNTT